MIGWIRQQAEMSVTYPAFLLFAQHIRHRMIYDRSHKIEKDVGCAWLFLHNNRA